MTTTDRTGARPQRERHVARSARILSTGLSATAILGITAAFGAAERANSATEPTPTTPSPTSNAPQAALAPLGSSASVSIPAATTAPAGSSVVSQLPSPVGTITLPTGSANAVATTANVETPAPVVLAETAPVPVAESAAGTTVVETLPSTTPSTLAPIAPAEPVVELTLPPPPSNGSSGGSR